MGEVGIGEGEGSTLNLPLPGGSGDESMTLVMEHVIAPAILRFKPDIILVSAGFVPFPPFLFNLSLPINAKSIHFC